MIKDTRIYGFKVVYEEDASRGIEYLKQDLSSQEARVFFDQSRLKGSAQFEDDEDRQFTLIYQNGSYVLIRRKT